MEKLGGGGPQMVGTPAGGGPYTTVPGVRGWLSLGKGGGGAYRAMPWGTGEPSGNTVYIMYPGGGTNRWSSGSSRSLSSGLSPPLSAS